MGGTLVELELDTWEAIDGTDELGGTAWVRRFDSIELMRLGDGAPPNLLSELRVARGCAAVTMTSLLDLRELLRRRESAL